MYLELGNGGVGTKKDKIFSPNSLKLPISIYLIPDSLLAHSLHCKCVTEQKEKYALSFKCTGSSYTSKRMITQGLYYIKNPEV